MRCKFYVKLYMVEPIKQNKTLRRTTTKFYVKLYMVEPVTVSR